MLAEYEFGSKTCVIVCLGLHSPVANRGCGLRKKGTCGIITCRMNDLEIDFNFVFDPDVILCRADRAQSTN